MGIQEIIVGVLFVSAMFYIGQKLYKSMRFKDSNSPCSSCAAITLSKIDLKKNLSSDTK